MELAIIRNNLFSKLNLLHLIPNFIVELPILNIFRAIFSRLFGKAQEKLSPCRKSAPLLESSRSQPRLAKITTRSMGRRAKRRARRVKSNTRSRRSAKQAQTISDSVNVTTPSVAAVADSEDALEKLDGVRRELHLANQQVASLRESLEAAELALDSERSKCQGLQEKLQRELLRCDELLKDIGKWNKLYYTASSDLEVLRREQELAEISARQTVAELVHELKKLQEKLHAKSLAYHEKQLIAEENERKLVDLRDGLSLLFPEVGIEGPEDGKDWVVQYLDAIRLLLVTVNQSKNRKENKKSKSNPSSRFGTPIDNGRISKGELDFY